jgi:predicted DNA-binding WGR domain protein
LIRLERRDPAKRMARAYRLALQWALRLSEAPPKPTQNMRDLIPETPPLSRPCDLIREWGRIGSPGKVRADQYPDLTAAEFAARAMEVAKRRRGYR